METFKIQSIRSKMTKIIKTIFFIRKFSKTIISRILDFKNDIRVKCNKLLELSDDKYFI